jgi:hypothetical protein
MALAAPTEDVAMEAYRNANQDKPNPLDPLVALYNPEAYPNLFSMLPRERGGVRRFAYDMDCKNYGPAKEPEYSREERQTLED